MPEETIADSELASLYVEYGDTQAFERLVARHVDAVYNFARSLVFDAAEAEDVVQDTFTRVWRHMGAFDRDKSFKSWVFGIARNAAIDFLRKKKALPFSALSAPGNSGGREMEFEDVLADDAPLADSLFEENETREMVEAAVSRLPDLYRPIVVLKYSEDLTFEEIAEVFGEPMNTVKSRYRRALMLLRKELQSDSRLDRGEKE